MTRLALISVRYCRISFLPSDQLTAHEKPSKTYYEVPNRRVPRLFGREEILKILRQALSLGPTTPRIAVIQAMGGQGKSQIALEYCRIARESRGFSAIFWVDATNEVGVKGCFRSIA